MLTVDHLVPTVGSEPYICCPDPVLRFEVACALGSTERAVAPVVPKIHGPRDSVAPDFLDVVVASRNRREDLDAGQRTDIAVCAKNLNEITIRLLNEQAKGTSCRSARFAIPYK